MAREPKAAEIATTAGELQRIYALDRTILANERTYAAWIRTGLAAMVAGLAVEHVLIDIYPDWFIRSVAVALIFFSGAAFLLGAWRYSHLGIKLEELDVKTIPTGLTTAIGLFMAMCSILALLGLVFFGK